MHMRDARPLSPTPRMLSHAGPSLERRESAEVLFPAPGNKSDRHTAAKQPSHFILLLSGREAAEQQ